MAALGALGLPKACSRGGAEDAGATAPSSTAPAPSATEEPAAPTPSASTTATGHTPTKPTTHAGAADGGAAKDAGTAATDAGSAKGTLPPRIDAPASANKDDKGTYAHYDEATLAAKVHARDPMLNACYTSTGKDPGYWAPRCFDLHFSNEGIVTSVTGKSADPLGLCVKGALLGVQLGAPKDKAAGKAGICMTTR